jgi:uncharacterized protein DUF5670
MHVFEPIGTWNLELGTRKIGTSFAVNSPGCLRWRIGGDDIMLWTIFIILLVLWLLGLISGYTLGGFIHILLVIAVVVLIIRLIQGRPVV